MLSEREISVATNFWADHFGIARVELFDQPWRVVVHSKALAQYRGTFALFRDERGIASIPADQASRLEPLLANAPDDKTPERFAVALSSISCASIGPAYVGYAALISGECASARDLESRDQAALENLKQCCPDVDWDHGGSNLRQPCSGIFTDGQLAAVAGYETWGGAIAHIAVVTHPEFRNQGLGRRVVAHVARRAVDAGLLPQYRTLLSNEPSMHVAKSLGFQQYAVSMAVRIRDSQ